MFSSACLWEQKEFLQVTSRQPNSTQEVCLIYDKASEETAYSETGLNRSILLHSLLYKICEIRNSSEAERLKLENDNAIYK
jgi:predicted alpha/beta superfamily hydrolase